MIRHAIFERHKPSKWPPTEPAMTIFGVIKFLPSDKLIERSNCRNDRLGSARLALINKMSIQLRLGMQFYSFFFPSSSFWPPQTNGRRRSAIGLRTSIQRANDKTSSFRFGNKSVSIYLVVRWRCLRLGLGEVFVLCVDQK